MSFVKAMPISWHKATWMLPIVLIAAVLTFVEMEIYLCVINSLPRPTQGEAVNAPWAICLAGYVIMPVVGSWLGSRMVVRDRSVRIVFLVALCAFVLVWYFGLDLSGLLSKAWRRGL